MSFKKWVPAALASILPLVCAPASAQAFPDRAVRLIVPFGAGGITDIIARQLGKALGDELGQSVIVDNRPGAGGVIAAQATVQAPADGYTLFLGTVGTQIVNPLIMQRVGYDPERQMAPIGMVSGSPYVLAVRPVPEATDFATWRAWAQRHPDRLNFGSAGNGSSPHLGLELLKLAAGVQIQHVPFKSGGEAVNAALGGQVEVVMDAIPVIMPHARSGRLRALLLAAPAPLDAAPGVPTSAQAGVPDLVISSWNALFVPAGTPAAATGRLNEALRKVLAEPALRERLAAQGSQVYTGTPDEYRTFIAAEKRKWTDIVQRAAIRLD